MLVLNKYEVSMGEKNANGEVTQVVVNGQAISKPAENLEPELLEWFRTQPRVSTRSNGSPKIKFDGVDVQLGYWATSKSEKDMYNKSRAGGSGKTTASEKQEVREELLAFAEGLSKEKKEALKTIVDKLFPDPKVERLKRLMNNMSVEQLELLRTLF